MPHPERSLPRTEWPACGTRDDLRAGDPARRPLRRPRAACAGPPGPRGRASAPGAADRARPAPARRRASRRTAGSGSPCSATLRSNGRSVPRSAPADAATACCARGSAPALRSHGKRVSSQRVVTKSASLSPPVAVWSALLVSPSARGGQAQQRRAVAVQRGVDGSRAARRAASGSGRRRAGSAAGRGRSSTRAPVPVGVDDRAAQAGLREPRRRAVAQVARRGRS